MSAASAPGPASVDLSRQAELSVAKRFMGRIQWEMILIGCLQASVWLVTFGLALSGRISLGVGFAVATACALFAYLPSHEAQHGNLSGRKKGREWIDTAVGHFSLVTIAASFEILRATHMKHHKHTNDPLLDVDAYTMGDHWWDAAIAVQTGMRKEVIQRHMESDPKFAEAVQRGILVQKGYALLTLIFVFFFPLETFFVWWLPRRIALSYLSVYFSWYPHYPGSETGRYRDTRFWQIRLPRFFDQSMQTHVIHHLYPTIPHWDEPKAMEALRPFMVERGVPGAEEIPQKVRFNPLVAN